MLGGDRQGKPRIIHLVVNALWEEEGRTGKGIGCRGRHQLSWCGALCVLSSECAAGGAGSQRQGAGLRPPGTRRRSLRVEWSHCVVLDRGMFFDIHFKI